MNNLALVPPLSHDFKKLMLAHYAFMVFTQLPGVFINTFLLERADLSVVLIYNILVYIFTAFSMHIVPPFMRRFSAAGVAKIGVGMYACVYLILLIFMDRAVNIYVLIGVLTGTAAGFYWLGYNYLINVLTENDNRDKGLGLLNAGYAVAGMLIPPFSGWIISLFKASGYVIIFASAAAVAALTALLYSRLPSTKSEEKGSGKLAKAYKLVFKDARWQIALAGEVCKGMREGSLSFMLSVALFALVNSTLLVGLNAFAAGIAATAANLIISRVIHPESRLKWMSASVSGMVLIAIMLIISPTPAIIVTFSVINSLIQNFLQTPSVSILFSLFDKQREAVALKAELFAIRELALGFGRGLGIVVFLLIPNDPHSLALGVMFITLIQFLTVFLNKVTVKQVRELDVRG
ncbi:MAG: MFS transporter [Oscillospiraceae bacterium]|jgi:MFS family permease|nr:MFS transporter [Oscillospiraceae bacterium]